jgi:hypothetical protein
MEKVRWVFLSFQIQPFRTLSLVWLFLLCDRLQIGKQRKIGRVENGGVLRIHYQMVLILYHLVMEVVHQIIHLLNLL